MCDLFYISVCDAECVNRFAIPYLNWIHLDQMICVYSSVLCLAFFLNNKYDTIICVVIFIQTITSGDLRYKHFNTIL